MPEPEKPKKKRDLTRERLVAAVLDVLREEGESALTMRRVSRQCGVTPMAIYHHVADKEELLDLALNALFLSAVNTGAPEGLSWRDELIWYWTTIRDAFMDCPGAGTIFVRRPIIGEGTARVTEDMFRLLAKGGITGTRAAEAADAMTLLALGSLANELSRPATVRLQLMQVLPGEETPHMGDHITEYAHRDGRSRYIQALGWILDGVERGK